jgi:hypothetical protein
MFYNFRFKNQYMFYVFLLIILLFILFLLSFLKPITSKTVNNTNVSSSIGGSPKTDSSLAPISDLNPTKAPTPAPTQAPTPAPTQAPIPTPTQAPTPNPTPSLPTTPIPLYLDKVTFYSDKVNPVSLPVGRYDLGTSNPNQNDSILSLNDSIYMIGLPPNFKVTLFNDTNFSGISRVFTQSSSSLGEFNKQATSIIIENTNNSIQPTDPSQPTPPSRIIKFQEPNGPYYYEPKKTDEYSKLNTDFSVSIGNSGQDGPSSGWVDIVIKGLNIGERIIFYSDTKFDTYRDAIRYSTLTGFQFSGYYPQIKTTFENFKKNTLEGIFETTDNPYGLEIDYRFVGINSFQKMNQYVETDFKSPIYVNEGEFGPYKDQYGSVKKKYTWAINSENQILVKRLGTLIRLINGEPYYSEGDSPFPLRYKNTNNIIKNPYSNSDFVIRFYGFANTDYKIIVQVEKEAIGRGEPYPLELVTCPDDIKKLNPYACQNETYGVPRGPRSRKAIIVKTGGIDYEELYNQQFYIRRENYNPTIPSFPNDTLDLSAHTSPWPNGACAKILAQKQIEYPIKLGRQAPCLGPNPGPYYVNVPICMDTNQKNGLFYINPVLWGNNGLNCPQNTYKNPLADSSPIMNDTPNPGWTFDPDNKFTINAPSEPKTLTVNYAVKRIRVRSSMNGESNYEPTNAPVIPISIDILQEPKIPTFPFNLRGWVKSRTPLYISSFFNTSSSTPSGWQQISYNNNFNFRFSFWVKTIKDATYLDKDPKFNTNNWDIYGPNIYYTYIKEKQSTNIYYCECPNLNPSISIIKVDVNKTILNISAQDFCELRKTCGNLAYNLFDKDNIVAQNDPFYYRITDTSHTYNIWYQKYVSTFLSDTQILLDSRVPNFDSNGNFINYGNTAPKPNIGSLINGPFIQNGTIVLDVLDTPNLPSSNIPGHLIYLSKPMTTRDDKLGDVFVYTFN